MDAILEPVAVQSLTQACIQRLESLILSGELERGEKLPSERRLAEMLDVSRPVVHQALVDLEAKGLVTIQPRSGVYVNDYRRSGSTAILTSLLEYEGEALSAEFSQSLIEFRRNFETEMASKAAQRGGQEHIDELVWLLGQENAILERLEAVASHAGEARTGTSIQELVELDFVFHQAVAIASGNLVYPLIINSFRNVYTHLTGQFFSWYATHAAGVLRQVHIFHHKLVEAIAAGDTECAAQVMVAMLDHGSEHLAQIGGEHGA